MKTTILAGALAGAAMLASPAAAVSITIDDGAIGCESGNLIGASFTGVCTTGGNADLTNTASENEVIFSGNGTLAGYVADGAGTGNENWADAANVTLAFDSIVTVTFLSPSDAYNALVSFGSDEIIMDAANLVATFTAAAGEYVWSINSFATNADGTLTDSNSRQDTTYTVDVEVTAVPLPAGALLLLTGLGGLAAVRRKRAA